ncbi:MAG: DUF4097 family beta strand repeat protein [Phycisphaerae bacterium]|nr:DUF4097 family beta strand repeat protein [Phycisphaerae bacterium]
MTFARSFATTALLAVAPLLLLSPAACGVVQYSTITATAERTQSVADAKSLAVETRNGSIKVERDDSATELNVTASIRCGGSTQAEADQRVSDAKLVVDRSSDGLVKISVEFPAPAESGKKFGNDGASFVVRAPGTLAGLTLKSSNGAISSDGFTGSLQAHTSNGALTVENHAGPVDAQTSNGRIDVAGVTGPVDAQTSNGRVEVTLAEGSSEKVSVQSSNGRVELTLPASWNGTLSAKTSNGKVTVEPKESRATNVNVSKGEGSATIGSGTATANLRTSNGSVKVIIKGN